MSAVICTTRQHAGTASERGRGPTKLPAAAAPRAPLTASAAHAALHSTTSQPSQQHQRPAQLGNHSRSARRRCTETTQRSSSSGAGAQLRCCLTQQRQAVGAGAAAAAGIPVQLWQRLADSANGVCCAVRLLCFHFPALPQHVGWLHHYIINLTQSAWASPLLWPCICKDHHQPHQPCSPVLCCRTCPRCCTRLQTSASMQNMFNLWTNSPHALAWAFRPPAAAARRPTAGCCGACASTGHSSSAGHGWSSCACGSENLAWSAYAGLPAPAHDCSTLQLRR